MSSRPDDRTECGVFCLTVDTPQRGPMIVISCKRYWTWAAAEEARPNALKADSLDQFVERMPLGVLLALGRLFRLRPVGALPPPELVWEHMLLLPWTGERPPPPKPAGQTFKIDLAECYDAEAQRGWRLIHQPKATLNKRKIDAIGGGRVLIERDETAASLPARPTEDIAQLLKVVTEQINGVWLDDLLRWGVKRETLGVAVAAGWVRARPENGWASKGRWYGDAASANANLRSS